MFKAIICALMMGTTIIDVAQGEYEYLPTEQLWIRSHKIVATWYEAKAQCEKEGAILASPVNNRLLDYMQSHISVNKHSTPYYIGIMAKYEPEFQFVSIEGIQVENLPKYAVELIEQLDPRDGECLVMNGDSISVVPWWRRLPYFCYKNGTNVSGVAGTTTAQVLNTPQYHDEPCAGLGYRLYLDYYCYKVHRRGSTWYEANRTCTDEGGQLVILSNLIEADEVTTIINSVNLTATVWVGLIAEQANGDWHTAKGENIDDKYIAWLNYKLTIPVCGGKNKNYSSLVQSSCMSRLSFICEKDVF